MDSAPTERKGTLAVLVVWLASLWVLAGACFKLFLGTPADLPEAVRSLSPLDVGLTYKIAISVELCIAFLGLLKPRFGWILLVLLFLVFDAVLFLQIAAGDSNCGCFGSNVSVPPWLMLVVDSALLFGILFTGPWRIRGKALPFLVPVIALVVGLVLPWVFDRESTTGSVTIDGEEPDTTFGRKYEILDVESWVGMDIWDTPLAQRIDVESLPLDGLWVLYRHTCDHCAEHLELLEMQEQGERMITLVRLAEPHDNEENRVVRSVPSGAFVQQATMPDTVDYVITTPAELLLEGGKVIGAKEGVKPEEGF